MEVRNFFSYLYYNIFKRKVNKKDEKKNPI
jgi:hypothetical protein